jgi:hypothetical protein
MSETDAKAIAGAPPPKTLIVKLAEIVAEIDHVEKSGRNEFQKYNYVKAADVAWLVRKALSARNIYLVADVVEIRNYEIPAREGVMQAVDIKMQFSFFDGDFPDVAPIVLHSYGTGTDKGDKSVYKAMTGALKYGLRHAFLIPDESDPEADSSTDKAVEAAKAIGEAKVAKLKEKASERATSTPANGTVEACLFYVWHNESQSAEITGPESLKTAHKDLLKKLWNANARAIIADATQLEDLKYMLAERKVEFRPLKAAS